MDDYGYDAEREERANRKTRSDRWGAKEIALLAIAVLIFALLGIAAFWGFDFSAILLWFAV
jgi:hypothetical protein